MGRGKDLTNNERATVHTLMKKNWNYEQNQFKHRGRSLTLKECEMYGVRLSEQSLKRYAAEMKAQEEFAKKEWKDNGRVAGYDFSPTGKEDVVKQAHNSSRNLIYLKTTGTPISYRS